MREIQEEDGHSVENAPHNNTSSIGGRDIESFMKIKMSIGKKL